MRVLELPQSSSCSPACAASFSGRIFDASPGHCRERVPVSLRRCLQHPHAAATTSLPSSSSFTSPHVSGWGPPGLRCSRSRHRTSVHATQRFSARVLASLDLETVDEVQSSLSATRSSSDKTLGDASLVEPFELFRLRAVLLLACASLDSYAGSEEGDAVPKPADSDKDFKHVNIKYPGGPAVTETSAGDKDDGGDLGERVIALGVLSLLSISYVHWATTGFALPAMLPMISQEMGLNDMQGALVTTGYSYLYAAALLPVGILADKVNRPKFLAGGLALWSFLTMLATGAGSFAELIAARVGFAAAQAVQNPVCFSLIPELFPRNKSTALAAYNCAIYVGRALSFAAVIVAHKYSLEPLKDVVESSSDIITTAAGHIMVPLDKVDLSLVSIVYTSGDMAAVLVNPQYGYWMQLDNMIPEPSEAGVNYGAWRDVLRSVAIPGLLIAGLVGTCVKDPREERAKRHEQRRLAVAGAGYPEGSSSSSSSTDSPSTSFAASVVVRPPFSRLSQRPIPRWTPTPGSRPGDNSGAQQDGKAAPPNFLSGLDLPSLPSAPVALPPSLSAKALPSVALPQLAGTDQDSKSASEADGGADGTQNPLANIAVLLKNKPFMATTLAASLNDLSSYALIAWQSTFYERVYHIESSVYAPVLAAVLPIGGIIGGVGGGWLADRLAKRGKRVWVTAGASLLAAPFLFFSLTAENYEASFVAIMFGFALSEAWRAPSAVMAKSCAPPEMGATSSALYLCVRNIVGGIGPLAVALMANKLGLKTALYIVPLACLASGSVFLLAEAFFSAKDRALLERTMQDSMSSLDEDVLVGAEKEVAAAEKEEIAAALKESEAKALLAQSAPAPSLEEQLPETASLSEIVSSLRQETDGEGTLGAGPANTASAAVKGSAGCSRQGAESVAEVSAMAYKDGQVDLMAPLDEVDEFEEVTRKELLRQGQATMLAATITAGAPDT